MGILQYDNSVQLPPDFPIQILSIRTDPYYDMGGIMHWHDFYEIATVHEGDGVYETPNESYPMKPGDIIIFNDVEPHQMLTGPHGVSQSVIHFHASLLSGATGNIDDMSCITPFLERNADFTNLIPASSPAAGMIQQHIKRIFDEYRGQETGWKLMVKAELLIILTALSRHYGSKVGDARRRQRMHKLQPVFQCIEENYARDLTLAECAAMIPFTPQYFSTYFRETTGSTFIHYLISVRMTHAIELLRTTDRNILDIAFSCGFNNMGNFITLFKERTGMTPSKYRSTCGM